VGGYFGGLLQPKAYAESDQLKSFMLVEKLKSEAIKSGLKIITDETEILHFK
jgi:hypothetical protein